jgi:hypothetical protein
MSTDKIENKDKAEQKISKDELTDKEVEKVRGGSGDFSFGVEQSISIGSATGGAGAGKPPTK